MDFTFLCVFWNRYRDLIVREVDNYQGEESDIVIGSFVRSNTGGQMGFVGDPNRLNVAISRARYGSCCTAGVSCRMRPRRHLQRRAIFRRLDGLGRRGVVSESLLATALSIHPRTGSQPP